MARDPARLRKAYEVKLGKKLVDKLSDAHIAQLSAYYNSLNQREQSKIDSELIQGRSNDFTDIARGLAGEFDEKGNIRNVTKKNVTAAKKSNKKQQKIPDGLDDLLKEIRNDVDTLKKEKGGEKKGKTSTIVKSVTQKKTTPPKSEDVDPRILSLLGLEDINDLDYDTYKTLLKERMMAARMSGSKIPTEESELIDTEYKKVKSKSGRFKPKPKKKTVKTSNFVNKKPKSKPTGPTKVQTDKLLPPSTERKVQEVKVDLQDDVQEKLIPISKSLSNIEKNLDKLLKVNEKKLEMEKEAAREAAKKEETEGFRKTEAKLEDTEEKKSAKKISKTLKPASDIFDSIINFFKNILLGGAINLILDIIQNPGKYLKPLIDFGNFIIDFINDKIIKFINDIVFAPINAYIGLWNKAFNEIEWALKQLAKVLPGIPTPKLPRIPIVALPNIPNIPYPNWIQQQEGGGQVIDVKNLSLFDGGAIDKLTGLQIKGMGKDTQLIAAQPGEIMMSKKAVDMFGAGNLLAANAMAGGNNTPKFGKIQGFQNGGVVLGRQGSAPIRDFGMGSGAGSKGYIVVPGHAAGAGAPGEMQLVRDLARRTVENLKAKYGESIPVKLLDMHDQTPDTQAGFVEQQNKLKALEKQGYEVLEIHMDASLESGYGTGRGVIPPMPGTDAINPVEADFARTAGAFSRTHRGGLAGTNRGVSLIELGNMSPLLQDLVLKGSGLSNQQLDALTKPLEESLTRGLNLRPGGQQAQVSRQVVDIKISPPTPQGGGTAVLPVPVGQQGQVNSAASAAQKQVPGFSAEDSSNFDLIVVKSIYNIVG